MCDNKDVIPITTPPIAYLILILNIFIPGFGTILMAFVGDKFIGINILHGLLQMITSWLIIGWVCSILWGILCVNRALESEVVNVSRHVVYLQNNQQQPTINNPQTEFINYQPSTNFVNLPPTGQYYSNVQPQPNSDKRLFDQANPGFINNQGFTSQTVYIPTVTENNIMITSGQGEIAKSNAVQETKPQDIIIEQVQPSYNNNLPQAVSDINKINQTPIRPNYELPTKEEIENKK